MGLPVRTAAPDPPGTTPTDQQSYGSPISRVWAISSYLRNVDLVVWEASVAQADRTSQVSSAGAHQFTPFAEVILSHLHSVDVCFWYAVVVFWHKLFIRSSSGRQRSHTVARSFVPGHIVLPSELGRSAGVWTRTKAYVLVKEPGFSG